MAKGEWSAKVTVMGVCLDPTSYQALSDFMADVPGAVLTGNVDHYSSAEREVGHALDIPHVEREVSCVLNIHMHTCLLCRPIPSRKGSSQPCVRAAPNI